MTCLNDKLKPLSYTNFAFINILGHNDNKFKIYDVILLISVLSKLIDDTFQLKFLCSGPQIILS